MRKGSGLNNALFDKRKRACGRSGTGSAGRSKMWVRNVTKRRVGSEGNSLECQVEVFIAWWW